MALNPKLSNYSANLAANAVCDQADNGYLRIYDGTQAVDADTALGAQVLLAELRLHVSAAFGAASAGVATAGAVTADASANATGTATWFRALKADGTSVLWDGSVGTATSNLVINSTSIVSGATVSVTAFTYTQQKG